MPKPRFRLSLALSADGFIADREGGVDWLHAFPAEDAGIDAFLGGIGAIVAGRTTYDQAVGFGVWPYAGKRMVVMTHRPFSPETPDTEVWTGSVESLAGRLARETTADVWVMGGAALARSFLAARRLDTLELSYVPVLLGAGIPLFGPGTPPAGLRLLGTERFANGIVRIDWGVEA